MTIWTLAHERTASELTVAKMRITASAPSVGEAGVHPGRDWFAVLSGTAELRLGKVPQHTGTSISPGCGSVTKLVLECREQDCYGGRGDFVDPILRKPAPGSQRTDALQHPGQQVG